MSVSSIVGRSLRANCASLDPPPGPFKKSRGGISLDSDFSRGADVPALGEAVALAPKQYAKPAPAASDRSVTAMTFTPP
jgi:hypothetical protein